MFFISFRWRREVTADVCYELHTEALDSLPSLKIWNFYLQYFWRKIANKQKHKIFNISRPKVTTKKLIKIFLTNFVLSKVWNLFYNQLKHSWENVTEKKIIDEKNNKVFSLEMEGLSKKKQYENNKVFCLKRKTLTRQS